ncbi:MAG: hypothetical protein JSV92_03320 [archaeon]|nr:MAG: hypothetical protein JSV92_03320 [archaeon]
MITLILPSMSQASTLARLDVVILAPGMSDTIKVGMEEDFVLNSKIMQRAVISDYHEKYDKLVIQLREIRENNGSPEAFLKVSALNNGVPVSLSFYGVGEGSRENCFGASLKVLDFVSDGERYVAAKFVVEKEKSLGEVLAETIATLFFG